MFKEYYNGDVRQMSKPTVAFILTKVKLNINIFIDRYNFDAHNHAQTYDRLNTQNPSLIHDKMRSKEKVKHNNFLTIQEFKKKAENLCMYQGDDIGPKYT